MTKREEIREEIRRIGCRWCEEISYCQKSCGVLERDLENLSRLGLVIKVEGELTKQIYYWDTDKSTIQFDTPPWLKDWLDRAGYTAWEPLIKE